MDGLNIMDLNDRDRNTDRNPSSIQTLQDFFVLHPMYHRQLAELLGVKTCTVDKWSNQSRRTTDRTIRELNRLDYYLNSNPEVRSLYIKVEEVA